MIPTEENLETVECIILLEKHGEIKRNTLWIKGRDRQLQLQRTKYYPVFLR